MSPKELIIGWTAGSVLILFSVWLSALNASVFWKLYVRKVNAGSWVPFLGGIAGMVGLSIIPIHLAHTLAWLPLLLDWGTLPGISFTIYCHVLYLFRGNK